MLALNGNLPLAALQFNFSNPAVIPPSVRFLGSETEKEALARRSHQKGNMIVPPTERCSLTGFVREFEAAGFKMIDASYKECLKVGNFRGRSTYHRVRFIYARPELVQASDGFLKIRGKLRSELQKICGRAIWRIRLFVNPLYKEGVAVSGEQSLSINLDARRPLFDFNGWPITNWKKDEYGNRVGGAARQIEPDYFLRVMDNAITLLKVE